MDWKTRLYSRYVSNMPSNQDSLVGLDLANYPYFVQVIERHVPSDRNAAIADLGCGHGALLFCLRALHYIDVQGVDLSPEQVELAHKLGINEVTLGEFTEYLTDVGREFDVVFMFDVLEHLVRQDLFDALELVYSSLSPGGVLLTHMPNAEGIFGMRIRYGDLTHEMSFTPRSITQCLHAIGFEQISVYEQHPVVHNAKSAMRALCWHTLTIVPRILLAAETGETSFVLSQNMLVVARKPALPPPRD